MDPNSGPDSPTYADVYWDYMNHGWLAENDFVPFWQPGYPWFLMSVSKLLGVANIEFLMIIQIILFALGTLTFYYLLRGYNFSVATLTGVILCLNPAIWAASTELMYEIPQVSLCAISLYFMKELFKSSKFEYSHKALPWTLFVLSATVSISMQPKILLVYPIFILLYSANQRGQNYRKLIVFILMVFSLPFLLLQFRNLRTGFGWGISSNFRTHIMTGNMQVLEGSTKCSITSNSDSVVEILCLLRERFENPIIGLEILGHNFFDFFAPYVGPIGYGGLNGTGTWFHGFDLRKLLPQMITQDKSFQAFDDFLSRFLVLLILVSMIHGFFVLLQANKSKLLAIALLSATFVTLLPTLIGVGDARYRLGAMFFYFPLCSASLIQTFKIFKRESSVNM
jgi:hypothetical protein